MKTKIKKLVVWFSVLFSASCLLLAVVYGLSYGIVKTAFRISDHLFPAYITPSVNVPKAKPLSMKDYVLKEFAKANIDVKTAEAIIDCESRFNPDAININTNKTYDAGIFQINSIHKDISLQDKLNYKTAVKWVINKVKKDGSWSAWACSRLIAKK